MSTHAGRSVRSPPWWALASVLVTGAVLGFAPTEPSSATPALPAVAAVGLTASVAVWLLWPTIARGLAAACWAVVAGPALIEPQVAVQDSWGVDSIDEAVRLAAVRPLAWLLAAVILWRASRLHSGAESQLSARTMAQRVALALAILSAARATVGLTALAMAELVPSPHLDETVWIHGAVGIALDVVAAVLAVRVLVSARRSSAGFAAPVSHRVLWVAAAAVVLLGDVPREHLPDVNLMRSARALDGSVERGLRPWPAGEGRDLLPDCFLIVRPDTAPLAVEHGQTRRLEEGEVWRPRQTWSTPGLLLDQRTTADDLARLATRIASVDLVLLGVEVARTEGPAEARSAWASVRRLRARRIPVFREDRSNTEAGCVDLRSVPNGAALASLQPTCVTGLPGAAPSGVSRSAPAQTRWIGPPLPSLAVAALAGLVLLALRSRDHRRRGL